MLHIVFNFIYLGKRAQILHLGCSLYSSRLHLYKWQFLWVPHKDGVRDFFLVVVVEWCVGKKDLVLNLEIELILDVRELALRTT